RLARVREVAHPRVANLYGVEREGDWIAAIWQWIPGQRWDEWSRDPARTPQQVLLGFRELAVAVEELHTLGLVHGALHEGNVLIERDRIRLTHVSPLLFHDPQKDVDALRDLLRRTLTARHEMETPAGRALVRAEHRPLSMRGLIELLSGLMEDRPRPKPAPGHDLTPRGRAYAGAVVVALTALLFVLIIWQWSTHQPEAPPKPLDLSDVPVE